MVGGDIAGGRVDQTGQSVNDCSAGMLHCSGFDDMELSVGLTRDLPIAHIAVIGAVNFTDGLFLNGDALHGFNGNHSGHADTAAGFDGLAERRGFDIMIDDVWNMFLGDGFDGQTQFVSQGFAGVPSIGRFEGIGVCDLLFKFFFGQVATMGFGKCQAVFIDVVTVSAFDLGDLLIPKPPI